MTKPPNLFNFATSELTQDAFLAYLIAWADPESKGLDPAMHQAGTAFLHLLLEKHGKRPQPIAELTVDVQKQRIDVLTYLQLEDGTKYAIVLEDKVHAGAYNDLQQYLLNGQEAYPGVRPENVLGIYLRTGNQADYSRIEKDGFEIITRKDLLTYFDAEGTGEPSNAIFQNYKRYLKAYQTRLDAYRELSVAEWDGDAWTGFYRQQLVPHSDLRFQGYGYVPNRSGGFQGCWASKNQVMEFGGQPVYLQFEGSNSSEGDSYLVFKMGEVKAKRVEVDGSEVKVDRISLVRAFSTAVTQHKRAQALGVKRPKRLRAGRWMTAAVADASLRKNYKDLVVYVADLQTVLQEVCGEKFAEYE